MNDNIGLTLINNNKKNNNILSEVDIKMRNKTEQKYNN